MRVGEVSFVSQTPQHGLRLPPAHREQVILIALGNCHSPSTPCLCPAIAKHSGTNCPRVALSLIVPLPRTVVYRRRLRTYTVTAPVAKTAPAPIRAINPSGGPSSGSGAGGGGTDVGVGSGAAVGVGVAVGGSVVGVAVGSVVGVAVGSVVGVAVVGVAVGSVVGVVGGSVVGVAVGSVVGVAVGSGVGVGVGSGVGVAVGSGVGVGVGSGVGVGVGGGPTLMLESPSTASSALFTSRSIPEKE